MHFPDFAIRRIAATSQHDAVDGAPGGFVSAFHGGQVSVGFDVVAGQEQVFDFGVGVGAHSPGVDLVDQQGLQVKDFGQGFLL